MIISNLSYIEDAHEEKVTGGLALVVLQGGAGALGTGAFATNYSSGSATKRERLTTHSYCYKESATSTMLNTAYSGLLGNALSTGTGAIVVA